MIGEMKALSTLFFIMGGVMIFGFLLILSLNLLTPSLDK